MFSPDNIRAEMARRKVTMEELASRTGLSVSAISKILGPEGNPTAKTLTSIAGALRVQESLFFATDLH
jgi:transcriptional regulator with XRE-family HTH domain